MFSTSDTIVGIATPPGRGGLGIVRLSGPAALRIALELLGRQAPLEPRVATFARLHATLEKDAQPADDVVATFFQGPRSYTAEDVVEVAAHGSPIILESAVRAALARGARLAGPGEFTFRAFVNGRIDLVQAEAVADLIDAVTPRQAAAAYDQLGGCLSADITRLNGRLFDLVGRLEASLDFPEEGYRFITVEELAAELRELRSNLRGLLAGADRGAVLRDGSRVALLGRPNAGKSTLFNALVGSSRAIVSPQPGTTRDVIAETIDVDGVPVTLLDTAGVREADDTVEGEGVRRAWSAAKGASAALVLLDGSAPIREDDRNLLRATEALSPRILVVRTKADLDRSDWRGEFGQSIEVSAVTRSGLDALRRALLRSVGGADREDGPRVTNLRHIDLLRRCDAALQRASDIADAFGPRLPEEVLLVELHEARAALEEVTGARTTDDLLAAIFGRFCIGK